MITGFPNDSPIDENGGILRRLLVTNAFGNYHSVEWLIVHREDAFQPFDGAVLGLSLISSGVLKETLIFVSFSFFVGSLSALAISAGLVNRSPRIHAGLSFLKVRVIYIFSEGIL